MSEPEGPSPTPPPAPETTGDKPGTPTPSSRVSRKEGIEGHLTGVLILAVVVATFGGSFQFGYNIGCINSPDKMIKEWYRESFNESGVELSQVKESFLWSTTISLFPIGGMFGGLACGWMADAFGRKNSLFISNVFGVVAGLLMTLAKFVSMPYMLMAGRFVVGINAGMNSGLVPMYVTELSPINWRGSIGSLCQLLVTVSICVSQILGLSTFLGTPERWPFIFGFTFIPVGFLFVGLALWCPESPKYTLTVKGDKEQAKTDLMSLRGESDVTAEIQLMEDETRAANTQDNVSICGLFGDALRWPIFLAIFLMLAQQFSGINAAMFYSTSIFRTAGLNDQNAGYATIAMGAVNVLMTVVSVWLVDCPSCGRRRLLLIGLGGMFFFSIGIIISIQFSSWMTLFQINAVIFVLLFVISFATGPGSIPWFFVSEIFPSNARGSANSVACMFNWMANAMVGLFFGPIQDNYLKHFTFFIFTVACLVSFLFTYKFIPETKNKTVEQIHDEMYKNKSPPSNA